MKKLFAFVLIALPFLIHAQTPQTISYQAIVRDASGIAIASATVSLRFTIHDGSPTGVVVFTETHTVATNVFGLVNIAIGSNGGNLAAVSWNTGDKFLQTEADPQGGTSYVDLGTTQLLSVPYALYAEKAATADNVNDADADPANEIQTLSFDNSTGELSISGSNTVTLPVTSGGDNWGSQTVVTNGTLTGNGTSGSPLLVNGILTDNQTLSLSGNDLTISNGNTVTLPAAGGAGEFQRFGNTVRNTTDLANDNFVFGSSSLDDIAGTDDNSRFFFNKAKSAFRAGMVDNNSWNNDSIGYYSFAAGVNAKAKGHLSTAIGHNANASGSYSTAIGEYNTASGYASVAMDSQTTASGTASTATGSSTTASGNFSTAMGLFAVANGYASLVVGQFNDTLVAPQSAMQPTTPLFIVGNGTLSNARSNALVVRNNGLATLPSASNAMLDTASGKAIPTKEWVQASSEFQRFGNTVRNTTNLAGDNFVFGSSSLDDIAGTDDDKRFFFNKAKGAFRAGYVDGTQWNGANVGDYSTAMGYLTTASGFASTASGNNTTASGLISTAWGNNNTASGHISTAMGENTTASGGRSTAMGYSTTASGSYSTAMGNNNTASGYISTALGENTTASGYASTAMGASTTASGGYSTAMGAITTAAGIYSTVMGEGTKANGYAALVIGRYNDTIAGAQANMQTTTPLFIIGNGTGNNARSNAMVVRNDGNVGIGISNPGFPLNFASTLGDKIALWGNSGSHYGFGMQAGLLQIHSALASDDIAFGYGSSSAFTERMRVKGNGNVGIGTTAPDEKLLVDAGNIYIRGEGRGLIVDAGNDKRIGLMKYSGLEAALTHGNTVPLRFGQVNQASVTGGTFTEQMRIDNNGRVGIGTTAPSTTLDVNGQIRIRGGSPGAGKVLTSSADGTATWGLKPYVIRYNGSATINGGSGILTTTLTGMNGQTFTLAQPSTIIPSANLTLSSSGLGAPYTRTIIQIRNSSNQVVAEIIVCFKLPNFQTHTVVGMGNPETLPAGTYSIAATVTRGNTSDDLALDSVNGGTRLIIQVFPE